MFGACLVNYGTSIATGHRVTYCGSSKIPGMLTFIRNAGKRLSQPVELFMQYVARGYVTKLKCFLTLETTKESKSKTLLNQNVNNY